MNEQQIVASLITLPRVIREHLVATYSDAAALSGELVRTASAQDIIGELKKQQAVYVRIAKALLDADQPS